MILLFRLFIRLIISIIGFLLYPFRGLKDTPSSIGKVVYLLWGGIGNAVMAIPAIGALQDKYKSSLLVYAMHPDSGKLLYPTKVVLMTVLNLPFGLLDTIRCLYREHPDITLTNFSSPTFLTSLISYLSGTKYRIGYDRGKRGIFFNIIQPAQRISETEADSQTIERIFSLKVSSKYSLYRHKGFGEKFLREREIKGKILGIHPGGDFKSWGKRKYCKLIDSLTDVSVILIGGEEDRQLIEEIAEDRDVYKYIGKDILKSIDLISKFSLFLTGDTGLMHIASAVGVPVVAIFGPTDPVKNRPIGNVRIIRKKLPCSPCYRYRIPRCKRRICLDIPVSEVLEQIKNMEII